MIESLTFIHFFTATCLVELLMITVFRKVKGPGEKWKSINRWYTNLRWTAVILDVLSLLIGFYISKFIYLYLVDKQIITKENELLKFLGIVLCVQIIHDFLFYFLVIQKSNKGESLVMDEFIDYSEKVGINAVIGDSIMYILATPILFYLSKIDQDKNTFASILSLYFIGYLIHQKQN
jgi:hypothetical protein